MRRAALALALLAATTLPAFAGTLAAASRPLHVRTGPGTGYPIVETLRTGQTVSLGDCGGNWCEIAHDGIAGWVYGPYLTRSEIYVRRHWHDPCDVDPSTDFHLRFGLYYTPLARYCRERDK